MSYMQDSFIKWIRDKKRSDGSNYSEDTISNYVTSLKNHAKKLTDFSYDNCDLFYIDDLNLYDEIYNRIRNSKDYSKVNESYHRIFSSALKIYRQFLEENDDNKTHMFVPFEKWLSSHPKQYTANTIKRYIRALEKAGEWLNTELLQPILNITSPEEFQKIQKQIKEHPDYDEVNRAHGHGDLSAALALYEQYVREINQEEITSDNDNTWCPSKSEYDPGFTVKQWTEIFSNPEYLGEPWGKILAMFYLEKNGASCKQIGEKYGMDPSSVRSSSMQLAQRIYLRKNCPILEENGSKRFWPILFLSRKANSEESGSIISKLRPELYEALTNVNILQYLNRIEEDPEPMKMTTKETIDRVKAYIAEKGFTYEDGLIENFWLCLKSKPFVILAGTSGTGKTRLVRLFSEAIGAEYRLLPVRTDRGADIFLDQIVV